MKRFYYQLKIKELDGEGEYSCLYWGKAIFKGIVSAETSKQARKIIKEEIFERDFKKGDDVLLSVLEITPESKCNRAEPICNEILKKCEVLNGK